jgi:parvulin-like peptidyl-prolyl isomerase
LVTVNGEPISTQDLDLERRLAGPERVDDHALLDGLVDQALILQEGRRLSVTLSPEVLRNAEGSARDALDDAALAQSLAERGVTVKEWRGRLAQAALADEVVRRAVRGNVEIGRQEIQDYYWENLPAFRHVDRKVLRQIFTKSRADAEAALREVQLGEPFAVVAARRGQGPEAAQGGLLGPLSKAQLPKALANAAQKLKAKETSPVVRSPWGWHLLYVEALDPAEGDSLDQAAPKAHARLLRDKEQVLFQLWLGRLREQAKIEPQSPALAKTGHR